MNDQPTELPAWEAGGRESWGKAAGNGAVRNPPLFSLEASLETAGPFAYLGQAHPAHQELDHG